jgi:hypothetical protein
MTLRIQRSVERELVVFTLTGRIQPEEVPEILTLLRSESPQQAIVLDLKNVRLIDRGTVLFLAQSEAEGAELRNCPGFIREWITQEKNATGRKGMAQ